MLEIVKIYFLLKFLNSFQLDFFNFFGVFNKCKCNFIMYLGFGKKDDMCMPLMFRLEAKRPANLLYLLTAANIFRQWKHSGLAALTDQTFLACIQTMSGYLNLLSIYIKSLIFVTFLSENLLLILLRRDLVGTVR